jgi:hypothetical protein
MEKEVPPTLFKDLPDIQKDELIIKEEEDEATKYFGHPNGGFFNFRKHRFGPDR